MNQCEKQHEKCMKRYEEIWEIRWCSGSSSFLGLTDMHSQHTITIFVEQRVEVRIVTHPHACMCAVEVLSTKMESSKNSNSCAAFHTEPAWLRIIYMSKLKCRLGHANLHLQVKPPAVKAQQNNVCAPFIKWWHHFGTFITSGMAVTSKSTSWQFH